MSSNDNALRHHVLELLRGEHAHVSFDAAVWDFPKHLAGKKVDGIPCTAWQLLEHLRISLGHPRVQPGCEARLAGVAGRLLAPIRLALEQRRLGYKRAPVPE